MQELRCCRVMLSRASVTKYATPWRVPKGEWTGQSAAVLASGPSMTEEVARKLAGVPSLRVIAVNDQFRLAPWADVLYAADWQWWMHRKNYAARSFRGLKVTVSPNTAIEDVMLLKVDKMEGVSDSAEHLNTCQNSGWQAINLAYLFGARRIFVFGMDMRVGRNGESHNFGEHPDGLNSPVWEFDNWTRMINRSAPALKERGVEVYNCSAVSKLSCFPKKTLEEVLCMLAC